MDRIDGDLYGKHIQGGGGSGKQQAMIDWWRATDTQLHGKRP